MIWTFSIVKLAETIQNCGHLPILVTGFASWDNSNIKIENLAKLLPKFDKNWKCWIGFNVNLAFKKVWRFEITWIVQFFYLIWYKNVELKLKFGSENWISFQIQLFELNL